jgi:hypothetical protein
LLRDPGWVKLRIRIPNTGYKMDISQDNTLKEFIEACKNNLLLNLKFLKSSQPVLWNRNRRNRNFMASGTGTVTCKKVGTGTVTNYGSGTELDIKLCI